MNHGYTAEQQAYDDGAIDLYPLYTGTAFPGGAGAFGTTGLVMGYFDGNTVTALWNYAQRFAMSDNSYGDMYGPSTVGAINVVSGQTNDINLVKSSGSSYYVDDGQGGMTLMGDVDPGYDMCSSATDTVSFNGKSIGDLLTTGSVTWGAFQGGFDLTITNPNGTTGCKRTTYSEITGSPKADFVPHHAWFQYYASTNNPDHTRPSSEAAIGTETDGAKHEYDIHDFFDSVNAGNYPSVSYLKAPAYQDGHAGYSDPLDEQAFVTKVVNFLEQQADWNNTAVFILYDDSDGWYDHAGITPANGSWTSADAANGASKCGTEGTTSQAAGVTSTSGVNGRCGPGVRQPFMVISPWAKQNYVDHTLITQASVVQFIEDNWLSSTRIGQGSFDATTGSVDGMFDFTGTADTTPLYLDNDLGTPLSGPPSSN
jgi:phospholipase C